MPIVIANPAGIVVPGSQSLTFTGSCPVAVDLSYLPGTAVIEMKVWGAAGGNVLSTQPKTLGAAGGFAKATFLRSALPSGVLSACVGGGGTHGVTSDNGGFNGGGPCGITGGGQAGDGGGYSIVSDSGTTLIVGGGGGGGGEVVFPATKDVRGGPGGGNGNDPNGIRGAFVTSGGGFGGTQVAGGASSGEYPGGAGSSFQGGFGQSSGGSRDGGGGGGGYYGGGGGGAASSDNNVGGGGGGSSYINPISATSFFDGADTVNRNLAPQTGDGDYVAGVAASSTDSSGEGGPGLVVISWS